MRLYKYRQFNQYTVDILKNERLFCAYFHDLNDPLEGVFEEIVDNRALFLILFGFPGGVSKKKKRLTDIKDMSTYRVCSLSATAENIQMWAYYADSHKGMVIEIEIDEECPELVKIDYVPNLRSVKARGVCARNILSSKTVQWSHEQEYRLLTNDLQFCSVRVTEVRLGLSFPESEIQNVKAMTRVPVYHTKIDYDSMAIKKAAIC